MRQRPSPALLIAHPGHELRIHGWLEEACPDVFIITDGSGSSGVPRIAGSAELLRSAGCRPGSAFGHLKDADVYALILCGDVEPLAVVTRAVALWLVENGAEYAVTDACEFYNPVHDLCRVIVKIAIERAEKLIRRQILQFEFAVVNSPRASSAGDVVVNLDSAALRRKIEMAKHYDGLAAEVEEHIQRYGIDAFRTERLHLSDPRAPLPVPRSKPYYEQRGEEQVRAGRYAKVLRYGEHFVPYVQKLMSSF
jgi:hypothetical protein